MRYFSHAELGLSSDESKAYNYLYGLADKEDLGVLTGDKAVAFFEAAGLPGQVSDLSRVRVPTSRH